MKLFQIFRSRAQKEPEPEDIEGHINTVRANIEWDAAPARAAAAERIVAAGRTAEQAMREEETEPEDLAGHINTMRANLNWDPAPPKAAAPATATPAGGIAGENRTSEIAPAPDTQPLPEPQ